MPQPSASGQIKEAKVAVRTKSNPRFEIMRDQIISCAIRLFARRGLNSVALQEIADELQVSKTALYHYFGGKDDLVRAVFADWTLRRLQEIKAAASLDAPPTARLKNLITFHIRGLVADIDLYKLAFREEENLPSDVKAEFRRLKREVDLVLRDLIRTGIAAGDFAAMDTRLTTFAIYGMCNWMVNWYHPEEKLSAEEVADSIYQLVLCGVAKRPTSNQISRETPAGVIARMAQGLEKEMREVRAELVKGTKYPTMRLEPTRASPRRIKRDRTGTKHART
jgi:AcrR family transcriptional regulator